MSFRCCIRPGFRSYAALVKGFALKGDVERTKEPGDPNSYLARRAILIIHDNYIQCIGISYDGDRATAYNGLCNQQTGLSNNFSPNPGAPTLKQNTKQHDRFITIHKRHAFTFSDLGFQFRVRVLGLGF